MPETQIDHLLGRLRAIEMVTSMLITDHPQEAALRVTLRKELDAARDAGLFSQRPESVFQGWDAAVRNLGL